MGTTISSIVPEPVGAAARGLVFIGGPYSVDLTAPENPLMVGLHRQNESTYHSIGEYVKAQSAALLKLASV